MVVYQTPNYLVPSKVFFSATNHLGLHETFAILDQILQRVKGEHPRQYNKHLNSQVLDILLNFLPLLLLPNHDLPYL